MAWMFWFPVFWILGEIVCSLGLACKWFKKAYKLCGNVDDALDYFANYYVKDINEMIDVVGEAGFTPLDLLKGIAMWPIGVSEVNEIAEAAYNRYCREHLQEAKDA